MSQIPVDCPYLDCPVNLDKERDLVSIRKIVRDAIADDRIVFEYQPILTRSGGTRRREALARLLSVDNEIIPAGRWIDAVTTNAELARALDLHVVKKQLARDFTQIQNQQIWINLTSHSLDDDFVKIFSKLLHSSSARPEQICLEMTEHVAGYQAQRVLVKLKLSLGVDIALDDLGYGFSNLKALTQSPWSAIKIDGGLVASYLDSRTGDLIKMLATLAKQWNMLCVAEWVEQTSQLETLWSWGVTGMQGFLIADPDKTSQLS